MLLGWGLPALFSLDCYEGRVAGIMGRKGSFSISCIGEGNGVNVRHLIGSSPRREEVKTSQQPSLYESANGLREGSGAGRPLTEALPSLLIQARLLVCAAST